MDIDELYLTVRCRNVLKEAGIVTIERLVKHSEKELRLYRGYGKKVHQEILAKLHARGLSLRDEMYKDQDIQLVKVNVAKVLGDMEKIKMILREVENMLTVVEGKHGCM